MMRSGLLLLMVAAMIAAGCQTVSYPTADSDVVESAVFSSHEVSLAEALAAFLCGRLIEQELGAGTPSALPYFQKAAMLAQGSHSVYSRIAVEALQRLDLQAAIEAMEASHAAKPDDPTRQIDLAAMYQMDNRQEDAAVLFRQSLIGNPTNTAVYLVLGDMYFGQEKDAQAIELLAAAHPQVADAETITAYLYQKAHRFVATGELERAIRCFEMLLQWNQADQAEIGYVIGELYIAQERVREARRALSDAIKLPRAPAAAFLRLGSLLLDQQLPQEAIRVILSGSAAFPEFAAFPFALGGIYAEEGQYEQALLAYEDAIRIASASAPPTAPQQEELINKSMLMALAATQERLKRFEDATVTLQQVLQKFPDSHIALNFLAYMWAELDQNLEEAYTLSKRSLALDPDNGAYLDTLAWIYYRKGELNMALEYLEQAREQLGPDPEVILHFGDVHAALGNQERARQYWKESLRGDPTPANRAWEQLANAGLNPETWLELQREDEAPRQAEIPEAEANEAETRVPPLPEKGTDNDAEEPN